MIKKIIGNQLNKLPPYRKHTSRVLMNYWHQLGNKHPHHKFLFILSPPFCGSTLLQELISTSTTVSARNVLRKRMGIQNLNDLKISKLEPSQIKTINEVFSAEKAVLEYFNYDILHPNGFHSINYF